MNERQLKSRKNLRCNKIRGKYVHIVRYTLVGVRGCGVEEL